MSHPHPGFSRLALATVGGLALFSASQAQAHAKLVKSDPSANATIAAPRLIHLQFSEALARKFSSFKLTDASGKPVTLTVVDAADAKALEATPSVTLSPGIYTVAWTAVASDDGHKTTGTYTFTIQ